MKRVSHLFRQENLTLISEYNKCQPQRETAETISQNSDPDPKWIANQ